MNWIALYHYNHAILILGLRNNNLRLRFGLYFNPEEKEKEEQ